MDLGLFADHQADAAHIALDNAVNLDIAVDTSVPVTVRSALMMEGAVPLMCA